MSMLLNPYIFGAGGGGGGGSGPIADDVGNIGFSSNETYPAAFYDATGDETWVAWEAFVGSTRATRVAVYDHASATWSEARTVSHNNLTNDAHGTPAICMDADGRVHCFFGAHTSAMRHSVTINARDPSVWRELASPVSDATYPHPVLVGSSLYLFARVNGRQSLARLKGTVSNGTVTWGAAQNLFTFTSGRFYLGSMLVDGTNIHGVATYADSGDTYRKDIYHFKYDTTDDSVDNSTGGISTAVGSQPISLATADASYKIYDQTSAESSVPVGVMTPDGKLHVAFMDDATAPFDIAYMNFSGGSWSSPAVVTTTTGKNSPTGYKGGLTLVPRADDSVELWFPNDDTASFNAGGIMKRIIRASGGTWGSIEAMLTPTGSEGLDRPTTVRGADPDLFVMFTEDTNTESDADAGGLKAYAYGAGGFVSRTIAALPGDPGTTSASDDAYFYNVALQVTFTGANGSTSFTDNSRYAGALTAVGNAQIQGNKLDLDGTGDYVSVPDSALWQFGSRVTLELFGVEFDDAASDQVLIAQYRAASANRSWFLSYDGPNNALKFSFVETGGGTVRTVVAADFTPATGGTEYDIALAWDGFTFSILVNGVRIAQSGGPSYFINAAQVLSIGCDFDSGGTARRFFNGRIEALRITRGINRSGAGSTYTRHALPLPTTQATLTDSQWGNVLLLLEVTDLNEVRDASPYDWPMTRNGNAAASLSVEPFSGANSLALDGTGDYVAISDDALLEISNGDITVETHARHTVNTVSHTYAGKWDAAANQRSWILQYRGDVATDVLRATYDADGAAGSSQLIESGAWTPTVNTWYHLAWTRSGNNHRHFVGGTQQGSTVSNSVSAYNGTADLLIGAIAAGEAMNGYLSELRITKGNARYTANFTAPSAAFPRG